MRQYESIWLEIKKQPVGKEVQVRVHSDAAKRLVQAVKLEKTKEVAVKKKVGMLHQGPLKIRIVAVANGVHTDIFFSLIWDGTKL